MRSTTCTERRAGRGAALALAALAASPAAAGPTPGCYARDYDAAHLAAHPSQIVARLRLLVHPEAGETYAELAVTFAAQGHVVAEGYAGRTLTQQLYCWSENGASFCGVECDGGLAEVTRDDGTSLALRTGYLLVGPGEDCGGAVDLVEVPGQAVTYLMHRAPDAACEGL